MLTGIDHLVIAVEDPDAAVRTLATTFGLPPGGGGRHESQGTFNRLIWFGDTYLELIGVFDRALAAESWIGAPTLRALDAGGGLATWAIATDALEADVARLRAEGSDLATPLAGERVRPDGGIVRWRLAAGPQLAPAAPFLIEHDARGAEWTPDDRAARAADPGRLTAIELNVDDVAATTMRLLRTLDLRFRPSLRGGGARDADIGRQIARVRPRRRDPVPATTIRLAIPGRAPLEADLLGCRWLVDPS